MMDYELSPWFSGDTPPVRPGVYEREVFYLGDRRFAYFHGSSWSLWDKTPEAAMKISNSPSSLQDAPSRRWRGILNPPKA